MAVMPGIVWLPLRDNWLQPTIRPTQIILHTAVDAPGDTDLHRYFNRLDVPVESHFWVTRHGEIVQMMDTGIRADANRLANRRPDGTGAISIETEDDGRPEAIPWNPAQIRAIIQVVDWACDTHKIPRRRCRSHTDPGLGWHSMFGFRDGINLVGAVDNPWSTSRGKICPGRTRIRQIIDVIEPAVFKENPVTMNLEESRALTTDLYKQFLGRGPEPGGFQHWSNVGNGKTREYLQSEFLRGAWAEIRNKMIEDVVKALPRSGGSVQVDEAAVAARVAARLTVIAK